MLSMVMYCGDNADVYPGCASGDIYGFNVFDWIYWRTNQIPTLPNGQPATFNLSPILTELGSKGSTNNLLCPMDQFDSTCNPTSEPQHYGFSYEVLSIMDSDGKNLGITTIVNQGAIDTFKQSNVRRPAQKFCVCEMATHANPGAGTDAPPTDQNPYAAQTGRFEATYAGTLERGVFTGYSPGDFLTLRHDGKADIGFVDGHADAVPWWYGTNANYIIPAY
jgi:prepilin-type processing-associated H-X9-DG protein